MTFYTLQYLQNQREVNQLVIYSLGALGLLILLFAVLMYSRNRFDTKYRDISIIMLLVILIFFWYILYLFSLIIFSLFCI